MKGYAFNVEKSLRAWRNGLAFNRTFSEDDLDELEQHLRDQVAGLEALGWGPEAAFTKAVREMGDYGTAEVEYRKVYWGKLQRKRQWGPELIWRLAMLKNHLKVSLRQLFRQKGYSFINVIGLAVGIAFCALVFFYVSDELQYDRFHAHADRIYRVNATSVNPEGDFYRTSIPGPAAPLLQEMYPEVEIATRLIPRGQALVRLGDVAYQENGIWLAEPSVFEVFSFSFVSGDPTSALAEPSTVLLTETTARKYFGDGDPVGGVLMYENTVALTVVGVVEDFPTNSHMRFDLLAALDTPGMTPAGSLEMWGRSIATTYVRLRDDAVSASIEGKLPNFVERYVADSLDPEEAYVLSLQKLTDIHLYPHVAPEAQWAASNLRYVYVFLIMGLLILLIACINYVNLATARALKRTTEVGIRKVLGSSRKQLLGQFLGESGLLVGAAVVLAIGLVVVSAPLFQELTEKSLGWDQINAPLTWVGLVGVWFFVSLAAGSYPAFYLSAFRPSDAIRGRASGKERGSSMQRSGLVVVQFATAVLLIVGTLVVQKQLDFMRQKSLGFDTEQILVVPLRDPGLQQSMDALKQEWLAVPGVQGVAFSSATPNRVLGSSTVQWEGAQSNEGLEMPHVMVDYDFMDVFNFELVAGRGFSRAFPTDATSAYVLNEAAANAIGWDDPLGKRIKLWGRIGSVIGVVEDFHFASLHEAIGPIAFHFGPQRYRVASVKIEAERMVETVAALEAIHQRFAPERPFEYAFMDEGFDGLYRAEERIGEITTYLTILALMLACLGLLGLTALVVEQRTKELGVRKVLGATVPSLVVLLLKRFVWLVLVAIVVAVPVAYVVVQQWLDHFAYRIVLETSIFLWAGGAILVVASVTVSVQAIKGALRDPVTSLRYE